MTSRPFYVQRPNDGGWDGAVVCQWQRLKQLQTIGSPHRLLQLDAPGTPVFGHLRTNLPNLLAPQFDVVAQPFRGDYSKP